MSSAQKVSTWTRGRSRQSGSGLSLSLSRNSSGSLDSPTSTDDSYTTLVSSQHHSPPCSTEKPKSLSWNPEALSSFQKLKEAFCTAHILKHPDPQLPFIVKVDAPTTGVGAVLSQYHGEPPRLHPCTYYSRKLTPAEKNYDIRNQELLAIKLALEEWGHWLKLVPLPVPWRPWSHIGVDFVTDLPNSCILVAVDWFSKACRLIPLKGIPTAMETAECLFHHVFRNFGIPEDIISDRGPQFISQFWKAFFKLLGVTDSLSSGYHPQINGQTERKIQELGRYLRSYSHDNQHSWNRFLPWAEYSQNSLKQNTTGLTPFQCILGTTPSIPLDGGTL